jgi:hypothetical protein
LFWFSVHKNEWFSFLEMLIYHKKNKSIVYLDCNGAHHKLEGIKQ